MVSDRMVVLLCATEPCGIDNFLRWYCGLVWTWSKLVGRLDYRFRILLGAVYFSKVSYDFHFLLFFYFIFQTWWLSAYISKTLSRTVENNISLESYWKGVVPFSTFLVVGNGTGWEMRRLGKWPSLYHAPFQDLYRDISCYAVHESILEVYPVFPL